MTRTIYARKNIVDAFNAYHSRITNLELATNLVTPNVLPSVIQTLSFLFQSTSFTQVSDQGDARVYPTTATSTIDEETNAAVAAYATFEDVGGNAAASADVLGDATTLKVPLLDGEAKTAYYRGDPSYLRNWDNSKHPQVVHTKQFMTANSFGVNVPGTATQDQKAFVYYDTNTAFNNTASISVSLWFYPTDTSQISAETFRFLLYRWIDASDYYMICIKPSDQKVYVFVDEAAAITKLVSSGTVNLNAWNLIVITYNPATNALVMYLNNSSSSSTPADTPPTPYTTNANLYLGGLPGFPAKRYTGYIDNFVFWTGKILTSGEAGNMWNHGTII